MTWCSRLVVVSTATILTSTLLASGATAVSAQAANPFGALEVVSTPVVAGTTAVVVTVNASHALQLTGVDPASHKVLWRVPYSASGVTPGEYLAPAVANGIVLDAAPAANQSNPLVRLSGIDAATGKMVWSIPSALLLSDNPAPCVENQDFCITGYNSDQSTELAVLTASTGQRTNTVSGPSRALGPNLYQSDSSTPTLEQLTSTGTIGWTHSATAIFGPGYDPGDGWNIWPVGSLNVGSLGATASGNSMNFGAIKTVGFSIATGTALWTVPGSYMCMGPLMFLSTHVACQYSGTVKKPKAGATLSLKGVSLKLAGFNPTSGAVAWTQSVSSDVRAMTSGDGLRFLDDTRLVVHVPGGKSVTLNTATGTTSPVKSATILWCQKLPIYKVTAFKGEEGGGMRQSAPVYYPCTSSGMPTSKLPANFPSTIGATVNGVYLWASPKGLQTHTVGVSQTTA
jgi:hypothetical protein